MLMRGTSPIANQSGQMMLQNQLLQAASQMTSIGQMETTDEGRSVLRTVPLPKQVAYQVKQVGMHLEAFQGVAPDREFGSAKCLSGHGWGGIRQRRIGFDAG